MALKDYQTAILPGHLYAVNAYGGGEQLQPSLEVIGGTADIYGSETLPGSPPTGMYKTATAFTGIDIFACVPNYLYIVGSPTSIVVSGLQVKQLT